MSDRRQRAVTLVGAILLSVLLALLALWGLISAFASGAHHQSETNRLSEIVVMITGTVLSLASVNWAVHLEHGLRGQDPAATTYKPRRQFNFGPVGYRQSGRYGPGAVAFQAVLGVVIFVILVISAVNGKTNGSRSSTTQAHGITAAGTVTGVDNIRHSSRYSSYYSTNLDVALTSPVRGEQQTVVHDPNLASQRVGDQVTVVIDPQQPSYAEFPGVPNTASTSWIWLSLFAVFEGAITARALLTNYGLIRHRRQLSVVGSSDATSS